MRELLHSWSRLHEVLHVVLTCRHYRYLSNVRVSRFSKWYSGDSILLARGAASAGNLILRFRGKVLPLYSRVTGPMTPRLSVMWGKTMKPLNTEPINMFQTTVAVKSKYLQYVDRLLFFLFYCLFLVTDAKIACLWPEVNALHRPACRTSDILKMSSILNPV